MIHGIARVLQETFFESQPAREGPSSALFENSRNLASSSSGLGPGTTENIVEHEEMWDKSPRVRQYQLHVLIRALQPWTHSVILEETCCHNGMKGLPEISDLGIASWKIPELIGISNLKSQLQDDLMTLRSITGRTDFPDDDMLDAMIASALKKLLTHVHFRERISV